MPTASQKFPAAAAARSLPAVRELSLLRGEIRLLFLDEQRSLLTIWILEQSDSHPSGSVDQVIHHFRGRQ